MQPARVFVEKIVRNVFPAVFLYCLNVDSLGLYPGTVGADTGQQGRVDCFLNNLGYLFLAVVSVIDG